jgi:hypothetical protein
LRVFVSWIVWAHFKKRESAFFVTETNASNVASGSLKPLFEFEPKGSQICGAAISFKIQTAAQLPIALTKYKKIEENIRSSCMHTRMRAHTSVFIKPMLESENVPFFLASS